MLRQDPAKVNIESYVRAFAQGAGLLRAQTLEAVRQVTPTAAPAAAPVAIKA